MNVYVNVNGYVFLVAPLSVVALLSSLATVPVAEGLDTDTEVTVSAVMRIAAPYNALLPVPLRNRVSRVSVGSRDATREAFKNGMIEDGEAWMDMIKDRNRTSHTYDLVVAGEVVRNILTRFHPAFEKMTARFAALLGEDDE